MGGLYSTSTNRSHASLTIDKVKFIVLPKDQVSDGVDAYWSIEFQKKVNCLSVMAAEEIKFLL